jgi:hypothetical protein
VKCATFVSHQPLSKIGPKTRWVGGNLCGEDRRLDSSSCVMKNRDAGRVCFTAIATWFGTEHELDLKGSSIVLSVGDH